MFPTGRMYESGTKRRKSLSMVPADHPSKWPTCGIYASHLYNSRYCLCLVVKSCPTLWQLHGLQSTRLLCLWDSPGKTLEWVAISFSSGSFQSRDWTCISCIGRQFLYHWDTMNLNVPLIEGGNDPSKYIIRFPLNFKLKQPLSLWGPYDKKKVHKERCHHQGMRWR